MGGVAGCTGAGKHAAPPAAGLLRRRAKSGSRRPGRDGPNPGRAASGARFLPFRSCRTSRSWAHVGDELARAEWHRVPAERSRPGRRRPPRGLGEWAGPERESGRSGRPQAPLALQRPCCPEPPASSSSTSRSRGSILRAAGWLAGWSAAPKGSASSARAPPRRRHRERTGPGSPQPPGPAADSVLRAGAAAAGARRGAGLRPAPEAPDVRSCWTRPSRSPSRRPRLRPPGRRDSARRERALWDKLSLDVPGRAWPRSSAGTEWARPASRWRSPGCSRSGAAGWKDAWAGPAPGRRRAASSMAFQNPEDQLTARPSGKSSDPDAARARRPGGDPGSAGPSADDPRAGGLYAERGSGGGSRWRPGGANVRASCCWTSRCSGWTGRERPGSPSGSGSCPGRPVWVFSSDLDVPDFPLSAWRELKTGGRADGMEAPAAARAQPLPALGYGRLVEGGAGAATVSQAIPKKAAERQFP